MAKQVIIAAMEEVVGEYILNMSRDNLKIAALRGKIKLEDVQLDGDLIGSHVLGAVGLAGNFGVLSCVAKSIKISVPWKNLEREPTKFEIKGVHLVCVPLVPSTATKMYGSGTMVDPRCSLRTRAKRLVLARLERNFWNGQIPGEGPPMKRIRRAVKEVERDLKRRQRRREANSNRSQPASEEDELDEVIDNLVLDLNESDTNSCSDMSEEKSAKDMSFAMDDLPELPRDWKVKLREKILRNVEATIHDVHIRCEVSERGLEFRHHDNAESPRREKPAEELVSEDRAFALGFTLESFVVRTANEQWKVGSHDKRNPVDGSAMSSAKGHLGPNEYVVKNNKIGYFEKLSIYWDDSPSLMLAEMDLLRGNFRKVSDDKLQAKLCAAMDELFRWKDPGMAVRQSLSIPIPSDLSTEVPHQYICESLRAEVRVRASDRTRPGPISCSADVLPFDFTFNIKPVQYIQYQKLKRAMHSQQRFDTMLRQRPSVSAKENPRAWWKYAIARVTSRPNSRPWEDVLQIVQSRRRYIQLVTKKNRNRAPEGLGFHAGLSERESAELLSLEDLLPIEALQAFHLLALRQVYAAQKPSRGDGSLPPAVKSKGGGLFRLRRNNATPRRRKESQGGEQTNEKRPSQVGSPPRPQELGDPRELLTLDSSVTSVSLLQAMTLRLGNKIWFIDWKLHDATVNMILRRSRDDSRVVHLVLRAGGSARSFGKGKQDFFFDFSQCDVYHGNDRVLFVRPTRQSELVEDEDLNELLSDLSAFQPSRSTGGPDLATPARFLDLPPNGKVCRIVAGRDSDTSRLSVSAHPATLIWTTSLFDAISEFYLKSASDLEGDLTHHIRTAATPLARKARLALLSPASMALHLNIAAPKIWVPIISKDAEGTLFLDAGTIKAASTKDEGQTDTNWTVRAMDLQVQFMRGSHVASTGSDAHWRPISPGSHDQSGRCETAVLRPFSVLARSTILAQDSSRSTQEHGISFATVVRSVEVSVTPVCLNLVDAEVLARTFGKWYSRGLRRVKSRVSSGADRTVSPLTKHPVISDNVDLEVEKGDSLHRLFSLKVEKVEIALEGHSKRYSSIADERSLASLDSFYDLEPPTRTYLVEVFRIKVVRSRQGDLEKTRLSVVDASIVRLREGSFYAPLKARRDPIDSECTILVRASREKTYNPSTTDDTDNPPEILRAKFLHNRADHLDEVEVDIDSVILRVTPTTLKDSAKAFRRIVELAQLVTKEMERKVHEEGRKARRRDRFGEDSTVFERPASPMQSEAMTEFTSGERPSPKAPSDSSILIRVTLRESTLLAGRPTSTALKTPMARTDSNVSFAVIQVLSNALIMFQSIENPDASGSKTLHISVDNVSALVNTEFERVSPAQAPPMIGPTGAEFRVVYATENLGCIVSQDVSLDCEAVKSRLTPNDLLIMLNVSRKLLERSRAFGATTEDDIDARTRTEMRSLSSLIRYQKKGTGIATQIRLEVHEFSFVLLRAYKSQFGAPEFLDFNVKQVKGKLEGCMSALSGDCTGVVSVNSFNSEVTDWEYVVEPFPLILGVEQMPNELVVNISPNRHIQLNLSGVLLRDLAEMKFDVLRYRSGPDIGTESAFLNPSVLSTVGLRRATKAPSVSVKNATGLDIHVVPDSTGFDLESGLVLDGSTVRLDTVAAFTSSSSADVSLSVRLAASTVPIVGEREPVYDLPLISSTGLSHRLHLLRPMASLAASTPGRAEVLQLLDGRASPETVLTDATAVDVAYYNAEPVVEWCMHNQRLRANVSDLFSLAKGRDLLSSSVWSPEDEVNEDSSETNDPASEATDRPSSGPDRPAGATSRRNSRGGNWVRPYLKNDSPEWTDMTCTLRMARDRVMLPDNNWIWVNDWTVDLSGNLGTDTDSDGWEYQGDFETFTRSRRYYERADACRRRRWTRTRMVKPPRLNDPFRQLKFVWEASKDDDGNLTVCVRSHVRLVNATGGAISFFVYSPSWDEDKLVGTASPGEKLEVPIVLASAVYMRLARGVGRVAPVSLNDCVHTNRFMILPTSQTSSTYVRTSLELEDVSSTLLHFLVGIQSTDGLVDIVVEPVLRIFNLLPCPLECQVGQLSNMQRQEHPKKVSQTELLRIPSGKEGSSTAVNPWMKPHLALRVPGYHWSPWQRIVNRKATSNTWRPSEGEEDSYFTSKGDADFAEELKTLIRFERTTTGGDPLVLLMSVECGHCPTIRIYSQYWILDKTGFGCRFAEGFSDMLGSIPDPDSTRRSHLLAAEAKNARIKSDMAIPGHQWSMGKSGMTMFFSRREKLALSIETGVLGARKRKSKDEVRSKWTSPLDISNVMPKTVFSLDEVNGSRRFELAINVTVCSGIFARTKMISLFPRYQVVNLLHRELVIAQDGCLGSETVIPSQSAIPFHWERGSMAPKVRIGAPSSEERDRGAYDHCWSNGRFRVDRVGITSMRLPTSNNLALVPMVVQAEVRLATKEQSSAVVVVIWSANEKSNPLYMIRNRTRHTILCRQPLQDEDIDAADKESLLALQGCSDRLPNQTGFECGTEVGPMIRSFLGLDRIEEFVWVLKSNDVVCFGFDDPEKPHIIEWTFVDTSEPFFDDKCKKAFLEVDAMGSSSMLALSGGRQVRCSIRAEHSTKVIEFVDNRESILVGPPLGGGDGAAAILRRRSLEYQERLISKGILEPDQACLSEEEEDVAFGLRVDLPAVSISVVDNADCSVHGREILMAQFDKMYISFSQSREGYHEFEFRLMSLQVDNHVQKSIHPVLLFCPRADDHQEPLLHMSAVRRLQQHSNTFVFRYAAIRLLEIEMYLDRRTAETIARFIQPVTMPKEEQTEEAPDWVVYLTTSMDRKFSRPDRRAPRDIEKTIHTANTGRIYFEQLHLHPVRIGLTFTQEWMEWNPGSEAVMVFQFIRGMASIANAPLVFTSFVVGHVFEAPQALMRVIATHYSSQLTKQIFGILGSLAILGAPADFISNVGTGVRDFFYEPIQGAVHGPRQFIEGLEAGTQSLARGVFVGVVRGAANVTEVVNSNLAGLTADDDFIDERKAHQRMLTDAMSRDVSRTFGDSLYLAGASIARGLKSGALGVVEQPAMYASKHGPVGFVKGVGKAIVGAVVKPVVGVGDAAVLVMNHMSDATSKKQVVPKFPKRLRRALPSRSTGKANSVQLVPYDERAAKAQKIVTGGESLDDVYIGHINIPSHLMIASEQCLWAIDRRSREPWCVSWEEVSHYGAMEGAVRIVVFSQTGLKTYIFPVENSAQSVELQKLLSMQLNKMANSSELNSSLLNAEPESFSRHQIPGIKSRQVNHVFGSYNNSRTRLGNSVKDEIDLVEQCFARVQVMGSETSTFLQSLDQEAWSLVSSWGQVFSGLSSRRCIVASIINGTGGPIQIKSTKLVEGGSPCYSIPTVEYDTEQGILHAGGVIIFFGWGVVPNLLQAGSVFMHVETNGFICDLADQKGRATYAKAMPGYQVGFLEKSYDDSGWWAKYWLLVRGGK